jgi:hypothetical protein
VINFFKKNKILELDNKSMTLNIYESNRSFNKYINDINSSSIYILDNHDQVHSLDIYNSSLIVLYTGEEAYIKIFTIPKVNLSLLDQCIKSELIYELRNIDEFCFSYDLLKVNKKEMTIIVYCINKNKILQRYAASNSIKSVYLIQFCTLRYYSKKIKEKSYIFILKYNGVVYLLACYLNKIVSNSIIMETELSNVLFHNKLKYIYDSLLAVNLETYDCLSKTVYISNFENRTIFKEICEFNLKDLGILNKKDLFTNLMKGS